MPRSKCACICQLIMNAMLQVRMHLPAVHTVHVLGHAHEELTARVWGFRLLAHVLAAYLIWHAYIPCVAICMEFSASCLPGWMPLGSSMHCCPSCLLIEPVTACTQALFADSYTNETIASSPSLAEEVQPAPGWKKLQTTCGT